MKRKTFLALFGFMYLFGSLWFFDTLEKNVVIAAIALSVCGFLVSSFDVKERIQLIVACIVGSFSAIFIGVTRLDDGFSVDYVGLLIDTIVLIIFLSFLIESNVIRRNT